jgi:hypothetical protein
MKLSNATVIVFDMIELTRLALIPTLKDIYKNPYLLFHPLYAFFSNVWGIIGPGMDEGEQDIKRNLITPHARGVVLDLGAGMYYGQDIFHAFQQKILTHERSSGHGHTIRHLDRSKVTKYIALEPNMCMHPKIREMASSHGFIESDGTFQILGCSASDISSIIFRISTDTVTTVPEKRHEDIRVDTIVCVRSACGFPSPEATLQSLAGDILKPGGSFLFIEHVLSDRNDVAWWQRFWAPIWEVFGQCRLDRKTDRWIEGMKDIDDQGRKISMWSEGGVINKPEEPEEHLFCNKIGRFVKHV